jgi:hypothetical protein
VLDAHLCVVLYKLFVFPSGNVDIQKFGNKSDQQSGQMALCVLKLCVCMRL